MYVKNSFIGEENTLCDMETSKENSGEDQRQSNLHEGANQWEHSTTGRPD